MCLYPKYIKNRKYQANKKNGGQVPTVTDERVLTVPVGCGNCMECRKKKAREWQTRLLEDVKNNTTGKFVTLTFSDEWIAKLTEDVNNWMMLEGKRVEKKRDLKGYELDNEIATRAMRLFNERWRKKYKKAIRHWMVTELGHNGTQNIHMHGIMWVDMERHTAYKEIEEIWKYGHIWPRSTRERENTYVNEKTVAYTCKYLHKMEEVHKTYKPIILTSAGIGERYMHKSDARLNKYVKGNTREYYRTATGHKVGLPIYWRNKIYTEEEREKLWLEKLDKGIRYVNGVKIKEEDTTYYTAVLKEARNTNKILGYGDDEKSWEREQYERERRELMQKTRIAKGKARARDDQ